MKILVLTEAYPDLNGGTSLQYVRTRNIFYRQNGEDVEVLNFHTKKSYILDEMTIWSPSEFKSNRTISQYDLVICHAANLKHQYRFLIKHYKDIKKIVFFYHGHEVLKYNAVYSKPYAFMKQNILKRKLRDLYDDFKFIVWRRFINKNYRKCNFVFVSKWMQEQFLEWIRPLKESQVGRSWITYNCVGETFEKGKFDKEKNKEYDFITIRSVLDGSKYCVDIVNELAWANPDLRFLLIGKGKIFQYIKKAPNLEWRDTMLNHSEMLEVLNSARCALMPTRTDAQGVMMCEMAAFGMPLITSNIPVCHEVFAGFKGIGYINNSDVKNLNLKSLLTEIEGESEKNPKYFYSNTCGKELSILRSIKERN